MKKATKSEATKKAIAERGTFKVGSNSSYDKPIDRSVFAAVMPYVRASKASVSIWGDTLVGFVPPAFAVRYDQLKNDLDVAMRGEDSKAAAAHATSLCKALEVMDATARANGHLPPVIDGHLVQYGEQIYAFIASGDLAQVRRGHPGWSVWPLADICAILDHRYKAMMDEVACAFPDARIVGIQTMGPIVEDDLDDL